MWCIPPKPSAEFVSPREDVLAVDHRAYDPKRPVVCLDESLTQVIGESHEPLPARPGAVERDDHVYVRNGVVSLFLASEPVAGWRHVAVTEHRCVAIGRISSRPWPTVATARPSASCW